MEKRINQQDEKAGGTSGAPGSGMGRPAVNLVHADAPTVMGPAAMLRPAAMAVLSDGGAAHFPAASAVLPLQPAPQRSLTIILIALSSILLVGVGILFGAPLLHLPRESAAPRPQAPHAPAESAQPAAAHEPVAESVAADSCLQDSTQVISSATRDALLLDAIHAYADGRRETALAALRQYTQDACDRATFEALRILDNQVIIPSAKEP